VWLVRDASGNMVRSGELRAGQRLEDITEQLAREISGASMRGRWRVETIGNARGQPVQIAVAEIR
jgi:hypothetical protein